MKHLLEISQLSVPEITQMIQRALFFKRDPSATYPQYPHYTLANLFYENSTRTRISFDLAAQNLGMKVVNVDLHHSSEHKGEVITDTLNTLAAMGIQLFAIRHAQDGVPQDLALQCASSVHIVNAGDGVHAHPSQALLDMMTILEQKPNLSKLKIAIVGNLRHSRVANSFQCICAQLGVKDLVLVAPEQWQPRTLHYGRVTSSLAEGIEDADVVMTLRVQKERLAADETLNLSQYRCDFAITSERLAQAKPDVMLMHPGPVNRDIEIDSHLVESPQSYILTQVQNGVFMRMAILEALSGLTSS